MISLENNRLVFRFPHLEPEAQCTITFHRTLRVPDTGKTYDLPAGLGRFPLKHVDDFASKLPAETVKRGGVVMPMWQAEAMWIELDSEGPDYELDFPVAIKIAAGKINAITGEPWAPGLQRRPQNYMVLPNQPWLDGFSVEKGVVRQFVATTLGQGYTVEEQLTGKAEWGGLQIVAMPLTEHAYERYKAEQAKEREEFSGEKVLYHMSLEPKGMAAGGKIKQKIYKDPFPKGSWDLDAAQRVYVSIFDASNWAAITGEQPPNPPPTAKDYAKAGLPWFTHYGADQPAVGGNSILAGVASLAAMFKKNTGETLPASGDVKTGPPIVLGAASGGLQGRVGEAAQKDASD